MTFKRAWRYRYVSTQDIVEEEVTEALERDSYLNVDGYDKKYTGFAYDQTDLFGENDVRTSDLKYIATHETLMTRNVLDKFFLNNSKSDPREAPGCRFDLDENAFDYGQLNYKNVSSEGVLYRIGYNSLYQTQELRINTSLNSIQNCEPR